MRLCSYAQTLTHNSNCTFVTDPIIAHWPFQTRGTLLLTLAASWRSGPGGLAQVEDRRLSLSPLFLMNSDETASPSLLAPFPHSYNKRNDLFGHGDFYILVATLRCLPSFGV